MHQVRHHRVVVPRRGGPDVLQVVEEELPEPRAGEVRVRMLAAGVSAWDLMVRSVSFPGFPRVPFTPGVDIVGVVDKLGEGVSTVEPGLRVALGPFRRGGGYVEFICVSAAELVPVPSDVDPAEAVCLVANYLTAYLALHRTARVQNGERILVHGAAGGVGTALLELGGWMPCSTPSAARGNSGVHTRPCAKAGCWCGSAWPPYPRQGCGSFH